MRKECAGKNKEEHGTRMEDDEISKIMGLSDGRIENFFHSLLVILFSFFVLSPFLRSTYSPFVLTCVHSFSFPLLGDFLHFPIFLPALFFDIIQICVFRSRGVSSRAFLVHVPSLQRSCDGTPWTKLGRLVCALQQQIYLEDSSHASPSDSK